MSCIQKRSLPLSDGCGWAVEAGARVYSSSGVLYNSRPPFLPLSTTRRPLQSLVSAGPLFPPRTTRLVFNPLCRRQERESARHRRLGDNGSHQASGINYARLSPREKLRAGPKLELVARTVKKRSCRQSILLDKFFVHGSGSLAPRANSRSHLAVSASM